MSNSHSPSDGELDGHLTRLLERLGYADDPGFISPETAPGLPRHRHEFQHAFDVIGLAGIMCVSSPLCGGGNRLTPAVYVLKASDSGAADEAHRLIWSQGVAPLILVALPSHLEIRNGLSFQRGQAERVAWRDVEAENSRALSSFRADRLRASSAWREFEPKPDSRVDTHLLKGIRELNGHIRRTEHRLRNRPDLINALVGRFLYLFILIDRGHVDQSWIDELVHRGRPACPDIRLSRNGADAASHVMWPSAQVWRLFDGIDKVLNGSIFPINQSERRLFSDECIHLIRRVLRHDDLIDGTHQFGFLDVDFGSIRTETISAMYQLFFSLQDSSAQKKHGAFYTPPYLADYILDEVEDVRPLSAKSVVCDPAAGSGIFLVGAYRRIIEHARGKRKSISLRELKSLLVSCIKGVEINRQAASVARFSLYLTMLDYVRRSRLSDLSEALHGEQLFPRLDDSIFERDFFAGALPGEVAGTATHIVGNPPWTGIEKNSPAARYQARSDKNACPVTNNRLSELFVWRSLSEVAAPGAAFGLLLSTKSFVSPTAKYFPFRLAETVRLHGVTNLSHFRYRLFRGGRNPATAIFGACETPNPRDKVWTYTPLLTSQPIGQSGWPWAILVDKGTVDEIRAADLLQPDRSWFWYLMLGPFDRKYARALWERSSATPKPRRGSTLGAFLDASGMIIARGGSPAQTNLPASALLGTDRGDRLYYRTALGIEDGSQRTYELSAAQLRRVPQAFAPLFGGNVLLVTRNQSHFDVVESPVAFGSSLNAIAFTDDRIKSTQKVRVLLSIARYLDTTLARYLRALTGRLWMLDGRRFEKNDVRDIPFPFRDADELLAASLPEAPDQEILEAFIEVFGLDQQFEEAVIEFNDFREGYQDAQSPPSALYPPDAKQQKAYAEALKRHLSNSFGDRATVSITLASRGDETIQSLDVGLELEIKREVSKVSPRRTSADYLSSVEFAFDSAATSVKMSKPLTKAAWTVERAFADAQHLVNEVLR